MMRSRYAAYVDAEAAALASGKLVKSKDKKGDTAMDTKPDIPYEPTSFPDGTTLARRHTAHSLNHSQILGQATQAFTSSMLCSLTRARHPTQDTTSRGSARLTVLIDALILDCACHSHRLVASLRR